MNEPQTIAGNKRWPQVDKILRHAKMMGRQKEIRREVLAQLTRKVLSDLRSSSTETSDDLESIVERIESELDRLLAGNLKKVINGTGIILSTNLGRAPLSASISQRLGQCLAGYCNLEVEMESGKRGERTAMVEEQLALLTGCQSALVVNNNAAAVMLAVNALAKGKEVVVSRGELIEIGGSFRLPDVIESAGGILKEVGATNRTRTSDYERAMSSATGLIMKCHRSNFEITGFTEEAPTDTLVALSREHGVPFIEDLGSGALVDLSAFNLKHEPTVPEVIAQDVDLVMFSGDKLMGGSQAGIICGRQDLIKRLRANPLYRAVRADKLTIGLLEQVLIQYMKPHPELHLPVLQMAVEGIESLSMRAGAFMAQAQERLGDCQLSLVSSSSTFGGGTLPGSDIESVSLSFNLAKSKLSAAKFCALLRQAPIPVIAIIHDACVLIDFRTVSSLDEHFLLESLTWLSQQPQIKRI
jgi:L-seryl-tRNA(Ser) seleniumtransferase